MLDKNGESCFLIMVKSNFGGNSFDHKARRTEFLMIQNWPIKVTVSPRLSAPSFVIPRRSELYCSPVMPFFRPHCCRESEASIDVVST